MKSKLTMLFKSAFYFSFLIILILYSSTAAQGALKGLKLCAETLIPSLFPFMAVSELIANSKAIYKVFDKISSISQKVFGVSGSSIYSLFMGFLGSYPGGIKNLMNMYSQGKISKEEAKRASLFCNNTGPAFCIAYMGTYIFSSFRLGILLYFIHILSAFILMFIFKSKTTTNTSGFSCQNENSFSTALTTAIRSSAQTSLFVCGFVVFFSVLTEIFKVSGAFYQISGFIAGVFNMELRFSQALILGFIELGSGSTALLSLPVNSLSAALAEFILSWGGLCVQTQSASILIENGFSPLKPVCIKLLQGILGFILVLIIYPLLF